jgi:hypothetical protein
LAQAERDRLQDELAGREPVGAVAAWIKGRLDLAFDPKIECDLRTISFEVRQEIFASPEVFAPAYGEILRPLIDEIDRGKQRKQFGDVDSVEEAMSIHGVTWVHIERQLLTGNCDRDEVCTRAQRFCLRGLGVPADVIDNVLPSVNHTDSNR